MMVSEQCLVKFKTGNYFDEVLCDIMPLDCCDILLGRPWLYDKKYLHDDRLNQYTIWDNARKQVLFPLIKKLEGNHCTTIRVYLVKGNHFVKDMKKQNVFFALIPRKTKKQDELEFRYYLIEFHEISFDNVPNGLPPIRSISHCMDLIPRASLPNKAPHKLAPTKNEELNIQVQEFLEKGLIRETLSPCVVPVILAPKKNGEWRMENVH